ncbi:hypothetical protein GWA97_06405 [Flavobacterium sp. LaA7.5]|nr:hypothetical protein [Flavobacterium salilacus subsp. altitudinum]
MENNLSPIEFFYQLLFYNRIDSIKKEFYNNNEFLNKGYFYSEYDNTYVDLGDPETNSGYDVISLKSFFKDYVEKWRFYWFKLMTASNAEIIQNLDTLQTLYLKSKLNLEDVYHEIISEQLQILISDLKLLNPKLKHSVFTFLNSHSNGISFFQDKDLKRSFYIDLYEVVCVLQLINDAEVSEEVFFQVFSSTKPNPTLKIRFTQSNIVVAYFLEQLKIFYNNFTWIAIEKSGSFYNKGNKLLTSIDLSTAFSRSKEKDYTDFENINLEIKELQKKHLKD